MTAYSDTVLLINPDFREPFRSFPIGLASLTGRLHENGYAVVVLDLDSQGFSQEETDECVRAAIERYQPILTGISGMITTYGVVRDLIDGIRIHVPESKIVLGGSLPCTAPPSILSKLRADFLVLGDGELPVLKLADFLSGRDTLENVPNLAVRRGGGWLHGAQPEWRSTVSNEPMIRYELFDMAAYIQPPAVNYLDVISGRGCVMRCNFCYRMSGNQLRKKTVIEMLDEIELLSNLYGIDKFSFADDNFGLAPSWITAMMEERARRGMAFEWRFQASVNTFRQESMIRQMSENGLRGCSIGIETGSQEIFASIGKGKDLDQVQRLLGWLQSAGVSVNATFIIGWPQETVKTIEETRRFLAENGFSTNFQLFLLTPYPGTALYDLARERGVIADEEAYVTNLVGQRKLLVNMSQLPDQELLAQYQSIQQEFQGGSKIAAEANSPDQPARRLLA